MARTPFAAFRLVPYFPREALAMPLHRAVHFQDEEVDKLAAQGYPEDKEEEEEERRGGEGEGGGGRGADYDGLEEGEEDSDSEDGDED